jgi:hypothetical protein
LMARKYPVRLTAKILPPASFCLLPLIQGGLELLFAHEPALGTLRFIPSYGVKAQMKALLVFTRGSPAFESHGRCKEGIAGALLYR